MSQSDRAHTTVHAVHDSPVGELVLLADGAELSGVYLSRQRNQLAGLPLGTREPSAFEATRRQLDEYFAGRRRGFELPLRLVGTPFQRLVWQALRDIPYGETRSYGQLARTISRPGAARAVGSANGRNPLSIVVPCHRLVGVDGSLVGYGGGLDRKRYLLELECGA